MKERLQYKDEADFVLGLCGEKSFLLMSTTQHNIYIPKPRTSNWHRSFLQNIHNSGILTDNLGLKGQILCYLQGH
jgi:hypothetical protein